MPSVDGSLALAVLAATVLAPPVCLSLLAMYRRAVLAGMNEMGETAAPVIALEVARGAPHGPLEIQLLEDTVEEAGGSQEDLTRRVLRGPWPAAAVYVCAGLAYAVAMTAGAQIIEDLSGNWLQLTFQLWAYLWVGVLGAVLVAAYDRQRRAQVLGAYFVVLFLLMLQASVNSDGLALAVPWLVLNGVPTAVALAFLCRPIRAVGLMTIAFLLVAAIGSQSVLWLAATTETVLPGVVALGQRLGLGAWAIFAGMIAVGVLVVSAFFGWPLLRWIGHRYEAKKFSDRTLLLDSIFFEFAVVQSLIGSSAQGVPWVIAGGISFFAYKVTTTLVFRRVRAAAGQPPRLLFLRVFRLAKRSEELFLAPMGSTSPGIVQAP